MKRRQFCLSWNVGVLLLLASCASIFAPQRDTSRFFAHRGRPLEGQLTSWPHHRSPAGVALFDGALATLEATTSAVHDGGDHSIVVGAVTALGTPSDGPPLLYYDSSYGSF